MIRILSIKLLGSGEFVCVCGEECMGEGGKRRKWSEGWEILFSFSLFFLRFLYGCIFSIPSSLSPAPPPSLKYKSSTRVPEQQTSYNHTHISVPTTNCYVLCGLGKNKDII